jgi:hypothetical protein
MTTPTPASSSPHCLVCKQTSDAVPLITMTYHDATLHICPQHLPILIHDPHQLAGILPGAENLQEADHHD